MFLPDSRKSRNTKCACRPPYVRPQVTERSPPVLSQREINDIRLSLFTKKTLHKTAYLTLQGKDLYNKFGSRIRDEDLPAICRFIRQNPRRITGVDLRYNNISDLGFFILLKKCLVKERSGVVELNVMNNELTEITAENLAKYAKVIRLKKLRINGNKLGTTKGAEYIADFLRNNTSLEYIDIGESDQTLSTIAHIITALRSDHGTNCCLKVLDLNRLIPLFDRYSYETKWLAYHVEFLLTYNSTLIELHLQKNHLNGHDCEYLLRGLRKNKTLQCLDLGYNRIGDKGAELLSFRLREGPALLLVNLAGNSIGNTGARALSFGLPFSQVRALDVSNNIMSDPGILDILNTLKKPTYMQYLNVWGNTISNTSCRVIDRMMQSGVLTEYSIDIRVYEVDGVFYAARCPNAQDRSKHLYFWHYDHVKDLMNINNSHWTAPITTNAPGLPFAVNRLFGYYFVNIFMMGLHNCTNNRRSDDFTIRHTLLLRSHKIMQL